MPTDGSTATRTPRTSISGTTTRLRLSRSHAEAELAPRRFVVAVVVVALAAAAWAVVGSQWIFPALSANSDEGVYLLQADALVSGRVSPAAPVEDHDAYLPWFAVARDGSYVLKYTPVHAAVLAASDAVFGTPRGALALLAAAQVSLVAALAREVGARRSAALGAAALFAISPLAVQLSITFLAYGTSLVLLLATTVTALRALRLHSKAMAALSGLSWGVAAFARPYDAALTAVVIVTAALVRHRDDFRRLLVPGVWALAGAAGPLLALLAFNRSVTGDALQLPFTLLEPLDRPGFGPRRALSADAPLDYTPGRAAAALGRNLLLVVAWTGGGALVCALAMYTLVRRRLRQPFVLGALLLVWPTGYFFFWGSYLTAYVWDGALFLGPYYYFPMVAALVISGAIALCELWRRRPSIGIAAAAGAVALSAGVVIPVLGDQLDRSAQRVAVAAAVEAEIVPPAILFVPPVYGAYLQNPFSFLRNSARLNGGIVFALDRGDDANRAIQSAHPDRAPYRLVLENGWSDRPGFDPMFRIDPIPVPDH